MAGGKVISNAVKSAARSAVKAALRVGKLTVQKARQMAKEKLKQIIDKFKLKLREFVDDPVKTGTKGMNQLNEGARDNLQGPPRPNHRPSGTSMHPKNDPAWEQNKMDRELSIMVCQSVWGATVRISMLNMRSQNGNHTS